MNESLYPSLPELKNLARRGTMIPVYREIMADLETPVSTFMKLAADDPYACLLESVEGGEHWARYSFISWNPSLIFQSRGNRYALHRPDEQPAWQHTAHPLETMKNTGFFGAAVDVPGLPRFWGGAVGYASYDMVRFIEHLPDKPNEKLHLPDCIFQLTDKVVVFDHLRHTVKIVAIIDTRSPGSLSMKYRAAGAAIAGIMEKLRKPLRPQQSRVCKRGAVTSNVSRSRYEAMVSAAKEYIKAGDIIQAVISQRFARTTRADGFTIYRSLRLINPSPYMYYLRCGGFEIIGSSPEVLVRKDDTRAETKPIAGTRPRGSSDEQEEALARELLADPKEIAEHIMLVDLGRNDLGRVCRAASVTVPKQMVIEKYSHVMHIVSTVTGILKPGMDAFSLFSACFPAGTLSGAPKVRAMQIIDELEPEARGPYAGAVGYFSYSGNMDMAITIRTIVKIGHTAYAQAGAGIVADSVPSREYRETQNKAAALFAAIDHAEKGSL